MKRSTLFVCLFFALAITLCFVPTTRAWAAAPAAPATAWCGTISTAVTWTAANNPYILCDRINISATGSLTIDPGVIVQSPEDSGGFYIEPGGQLIANGTSQLPIKFTAIDPTKLWDSIIVTDGGILRLDNVDIAYAEANHSSGKGVLYLYGSDVQVRNTRIHHNSSMGVWITSPGLTPLFENVTIDNNTGVAIFQNNITAQPVYHNIIMSANAGGDFLYINDGYVDRDTTLDSTGLNGKPIQLGSMINVYRILTITPGAEIRMVPNSGVFVQNGGKLVAEGTAANPIRFTAVDIAKPWNAIMVNYGASASLNYCDISYANSSYSTGNGVLYLYVSDVQVRNTRIHDNTGVAVNIAAAGLTPLFEDVTIDRNTGVAIFQFYITAQPVYHNINIHDNAGGNFLYVNSGSVYDFNATLDSTGLNGKHIQVGGAIDVYRTLTTVHSLEFLA